MQVKPGQIWSAKNAKVNRIEVIVNKVLGPENANIVIYHLLGQKKRARKSELEMSDFLYEFEPARIGLGSYGI